MYISTRGNFEEVTASEAIRLGMVPTGGLFVPAELPSLSREEILEMQGKPYQETARRVMSLFLPDFLPEEINDCVEKAYNENNFDHASIAPLFRLDSHTYFLELWHGPTAAFKDIALQLMPHLLSLALQKAGVKRKIAILVATSGDTGKAALEGFKNVPGIKIIVFYPYGGVSRVQELQMTATDGFNTYAVAVRGNFDDCQNSVKEIFADEEFKKILAGKSYELSSANSINWGRLLPQVVYYFRAYLNLLEKKEIIPGERINFVVPTGNFGNILAGWYAGRMGLPINKLICASNENKVLTDFFQSGIYDRNREFKQTSSPSMDILISSNLERFLFEISNHCAGKINRWMTALKETGRFDVDTGTRQAMEQIIAAGFAVEEETLSAIEEVFETGGYLLDTHTAVGFKVYQKYLAATGDKSKTVICATASPFKFSSSVLQAIKGKDYLSGKDEFGILQELSRLSKIPVHPGLRNLEAKPVLHRTVCERKEIKAQVEKILGI
ncbi:MAG: threonine synthase [Desulfobacteraceae bacterium]|jgi:threonine synthase|nr:MAG: threonine synthase [Desulfobacteraceae bacterium]